MNREPGRKKCCGSAGGVNSIVDDTGAVGAVEGPRSFKLEALGRSGGRSCRERGAIGEGWILGGEGTPWSSSPSLPLSVPNLAMRGCCGVTSPSCMAGSSYRFQKKSMV
jgi:hypothetical protein